MSGIPIHSQDPIKPTKASGVTPQKMHSHNQSMPSQPASNATYPPSRPGAAMPTPTASVVSAASDGPPPPQPGAVPVAQPPMTTAKASLPPPPKVGEKPQPPEYYAPVQSQPCQPQPYPPQMSKPPLGPHPNGLPPASTTSTIIASSFGPGLPPTSLPESVETSARPSLEHPPGYVQNPYASDMRPDPRLATQEENEKRSERLPPLGYNDNSKQNSVSGSENDRSMFETALKWGKEKGKQLGDLHEQVWDNIGRK